MKIGILGSGQWGTAIAMLTAEAGHQPQIGFRQSRPPRGFPSSPNLAAIAREADLVIIATQPNWVGTLVRDAELTPRNQVLVASRGIDPDSGGWLSEVVLSNSPVLQVGVLTGPAIASEIMENRAGALVAASSYAAVSAKAQQALHSRLCRVYTSSDLIGVELAGAMVDVLTILLGVADAQRQGTGAHGIIVSRGLAEAVRLGNALGASEHTFLGLAGVGDIFATGTHPQNPKYLAGQKLGRNEGLSERLLQKLISIQQLAKRQQVELPLTEATIAMGRGQIEPQLAIDKLMRRRPTQE